jgi:protoporphyrin/coproporphyrin ferrochelatase
MVGWVVDFRPNDGVLLVAHGTVRDLDELPEFLLRIRHGRPASPELVAELRRRYEAIGGSPLLEITRQQGKALARQLELPVLTAMRLWQPTVEEALRAASSLRLQRLCVVPLAPYSVHVYALAAARSLEAVRAELGAAAPLLVACEPWGCEPAFVGAWARAIGERCQAADAIVLSAHSLPSRAIAMGDPYELQFRASAGAIEAALGRACEVAFQSAGADGGDWLGPDILEVLETMATRGARRVVVAPVGFVAEHVETLYDLDIEAAGRARELGMELFRVSAPNADPGLIEALASVTVRALA